MFTTTAVEYQLRTREFSFVINNVGLRKSREINVGGWGCSVSMKMAAEFILLRVLVLVVARFISVQSLSERPSCSRTLTSFRDLQAATKQTETSYTSDYVLCVNLQPGHNDPIGYSSAAIDSFSLIITGSSQGAGSDDASPAAVVKCNSSVEPSQSEYPLAVTNSSLVVIEGVQFEDCLRPLKFNQVQRVELRHSKFR